MRGLSAEELRGLNKWADVRLIDAFEAYGDRVYLMALQDASGVPYKSAADPDVAGLIDTYEKIGAELERRLKLGDKGLPATFEGHTRAIAHHSAYLAGALGVPDDGKSAGEVAQEKAGYNSVYAELTVALEK